MSSTTSAGPQRSARQMSPVTAAKTHARLSDLDAIKVRRDSGMDPTTASSQQTPTVRAAPKRKPAVRRARHFVEEPLYLLPTHYALLQDSTFELLRGLANLSSTVEDDPLYFDQLLGAAVNVKHAFDLGRMDVINGTIRPRNTSLCHECITTVSSVWRSGPDGPRTLCNACGLRYYKQNQRRAIEAKRRESRDAADAAASLATLGALDIKAARKLLAGNAATRLDGVSSSSNKRARNSVATSASTVGNANIYSDDDEENDDDDNDNSDDEDNADYDEDRDGDANDKNDNDGGALTVSHSNVPCDGLSTAPLATTNQTFPHRHSTAVVGSAPVAQEHPPAVMLPSIASICNRIPTLPPLPSRLPPQQQLFLPPMMLPPFQISSAPLHQHAPLPLVPSSSSISSLTSSSSTPLTQVATGSRTIPTTGNAPVYASQYYPPPPSNGNSQHHHYYHPQLQ
ncbi:hypothetical protein GGI19_001483 [Coemansia pectinata]|uniref:GATA-type domain-containing protein n=1 Tax=Coemansia pectinata TaxID=1052879 RepID=A0A9W8H1J1_9FUNG|nr:hypothetical protein GGI19_001483 [Coemansia pectinata]